MTSSTATLTNQSNHNIMKANLTNLRKALKACAKAHKTSFENWASEGQLGIGATTIPVVADVQMICEAFFGKTNMVETGYGYTTVWINEEPFLPEVDEMTLEFALPYGTVL